MAKSNITRHWPTALLGTLVALIFLIAVFSFQVSQNELAVVTTMGNVSQESPGPGLHFRWPYPIQQVFKFDKRDRTFSGLNGIIEETTTADIQNLLAGIFVVYNIDDAQKFFARFKTMRTAEQALSDWMQSSRKAVFGQYGIGTIINADNSKLRLNEICDKIKNELVARTTDCGIKIKMVGINALNVPAGVTPAVFTRMAQERQTAAAQFEAQGRSEAEKIRLKADTDRIDLLATAQAEARQIQAEGDAQAAAFYQTFAKNPELAAFLRKMQALREITKNKSTLVFDDSTSPFDLLKPGALNLEPANK